MKRIILLALLLACSTARAAEWVSAGVSRAGNYQEAFVDISSIRIEGPIRRAWIKVIVAPHTDRGPAADPAKWVDHTLSRDAFNCGEEKVKFEAFTVYYDDETNSSVENNSETWDYVRPDSFLSTEMRFICAWKPK